MKRFFILLTAVVVFSGCAKAAHLNQLLTLDRYSKNKDVQAQHVKKQNENFERLLAAVRQSEFSLSQGTEIRREFGAPVFSRAVEREGQKYDCWLYRHPVRFSDTEKVYLYFDGGGILKDWEHVSPPKKTENLGQDS